MADPFLNWRQWGGFPAGKRPTGKAEIALCGLLVGLGGTKKSPAGAGPSW